MGESFGIVPPPPLEPADGGADRFAKKPPPLPETLTGALTLMVWPACNDNFICQPGPWSTLLTKPQYGAYI